ncbi:hypothetical protein FACS1894162_5250 [Bacteroidia bacterium]|nr:hypothetical protein FACS1894162_5250 [Bacteroidia bacterium]
MRMQKLFYLSIAIFCTLLLHSCKDRICESFYELSLKSITESKWSAINYFPQNIFNPLAIPVPLDNIKLNGVTYSTVIKLENNAYLIYIAKEYGIVQITDKGSNEIWSLNRMSGSITQAQKVNVGGC